MGRLLPQAMQSFAFDRNELAGALGDIGVFVPIVAALVTFNGVNATMALVVAGLLYAASGIYFKVPVPVQPLKAVAAIAIASGVGPSVLSAAGIWMGAILVLLAVTGLADSIERLLSRPVIRGIQLALGLTLVKAGYELMMKKQFLIGGTKLTFSAFGHALPVGLLAGIAGIAIILVFKTSKRWPASLIVIGLGALVGLFLGGYERLASLQVGMSPWQSALPGRADFLLALTLLVIPQIPLTLANSIAATATTASAYFGRKAHRVTPKALSLSLGAANTLSGLMGGMPLCHGAGGMTAHYKFGARSGGANLIIGMLLVLLGLLFGRSAVTLMSLVPFSIYGILLMYLGLEHALLIADSVEDKHHLFIALAIGALSAASGNLFVAVMAGIGLNLGLEVVSRRSAPGPALPVSLSIRGDATARQLALSCSQSSTSNPALRGSMKCGGSW